jgi:hypothetical protein
MDMCMVDENVLHGLLEMPFSRKGIAEKCKIIKDG